MNSALASSSIPFPASSRGHPSYYLDGIGVTLVSSAGYFLPFYVAFPLSGVIQVIALGVLTAVSYGVANNILAARQCVEYYTVGHSIRHKGLIASDSPLLNGIVHGIAATWKSGLKGGTLLAIAARATRIVAATAYRLTPFAFGLALITLFYAQYRSKVYAFERESLKAQEAREFTAYFQQVLYPEKGYDPVYLAHIPENKRMAYLSVAERNRVGYDMMPIGAAVMAFAVFGGRIGLHYF